MATKFYVAQNKNSVFSSAEAPKDVELIRMGDWDVISFDTRESMDLYVKKNHGKKVGSMFKQCFHINENQVENFACEGFRI